MTNLFWSHKLFVTAYKSFSMYTQAMWKSKNHCKGTQNYFEYHTVLLWGQNSMCWQSHFEFSEVTWIKRCHCESHTVVESITVSWWRKHEVIARVQTSMLSLWGHKSHYENHRETLWRPHRVNFKAFSLIERVTQSHWVKTLIWGYRSHCEST